MKKIIYCTIVILLVSCSSQPKKLPWKDQEFEDYLTSINVPFKINEETGKVSGIDGTKLYDKYYSDFLEDEIKNSQKGITNLKSNKAYFSYYANDFLEDSNLGNNNFKNRFCFSIIKIDKLRSIVAFASIYYFDDKKLDKKKINLDSLFLNAEHKFVKIKGNTLIFPKGKVKHKRSFFDFATPGVSKYGGEKFKTTNYKYVYDSIQGFITNENFLK